MYFMKKMRMANFFMFWGQGIQVSIEGNFWQILAEDEQRPKLAFAHPQIPLLYEKLEDRARYAGLLLAPAECFSLWPRTFFAF